MTKKLFANRRGGEETTTLATAGEVQQVDGVNIETSADGEVGSPAIETHVNEAEQPTNGQENSTVLIEENNLAATALIEGNADEGEEIGEQPAVLADNRHLRELLPFKIFIPGNYRPTINKTVFQSRIIKTPLGRHYSPQLGRFDRLPLNVARNFFKWSSWEEMLSKTDERNVRHSFIGTKVRPTVYQIVQEQLKGMTDEMLLAEGFKIPINLEIDLHEPVGWSSTIPAGELADELKMRGIDPDKATFRRPLSNNVSATFVATPQVPAPLTSVVSLSGLARPDRITGTGWIFLVLQLHPGPQLGRVAPGANISDASGLILFGPNHPGVGYPGAKHR